MSGAGKTLGHNKPDKQGEFTLTQLHRDAVEATERVRARLNVEQARR
ncbi:hypothetical protein ACTPOK_41975 [Streptomyces inhibens]